MSNQKNLRTAVENRGDVPENEDITESHGSHWRWNSTSFEDNLRSQHVHQLNQVLTLFIHPLVRIITQKHLPAHYSHYSEKKQGLYDHQNQLQVILTLWL